MERCGQARADAATGVVIEDYAAQPISLTKVVRKVN